MYHGILGSVVGFLYFSFSGTINTSGFCFTSFENIALRPLCPLIGFWCSLCGYKFDLWHSILHLREEKCTWRQWWTSLCFLFTLAQSLSFRSSAAFFQLLHLSSLMLLRPAAAQSVCWQWITPSILSTSLLLLQLLWYPLSSWRQSVLDWSQLGTSALFRATNRVAGES